MFQLADNYSSKLAAHSGQGHTEIVEGWRMAGGNLIYVGQSGVVQWWGTACERALNVPEDACTGWSGGQGAARKRPDGRTDRLLKQDAQF